MARPLCATIAAAVILVLSVPAFAGRVKPAASELDRVADAVYGAESSYGKDPAMWRPDPFAPQGPMQVGEAAAEDVGGGDRFDIRENLAIGRAYLALLYRRYGNWRDAISAYNWGIGNLDGWIRRGRRKKGFAPARYLGRVLRDSGLCGFTSAVQQGCASRRISIVRGLDGSGEPLAGLFGSGRLQPAMKESGRPLAGLAGSGRLRPAMKESGRPLARLERGRHRRVARRAGSDRFAARRQLLNLSEAGSTRIKR